MTLTFVIALCAILLLILSVALLYVSSSNTGYVSVYPSKIPLHVSMKEVQQVRNAYLSRTEDDVTFYKKTDQNMSSVFYDILKTHSVKLSEIEKVAYNSRLMFEIMKQKAVYNRVRPYQIDRSILPPKDSYTYHTPSYPAGHAAQSYYIARYFGCLYPELKEQLLAIAYAIDETRVKAGIHYPSDGVFAREVVDTTMMSTLC